MKELPMEKLYEMKRETFVKFTTLFVTLLSNFVFIQTLSKKTPNGENCHIDNRQMLFLNFLLQEKRKVQNKNNFPLFA